LIAQRETIGESNVTFTWRRSDERRSAFFKSKTEEAHIMKAYNFAKFLIRQRMLGFTVPDVPHFDDSSTEWFLGRLVQSTRYLEFGSGGSTYMAAKLGIDFVAVDSDPFFLAQVEEKIRRDGYARPGGVFKHADIGLTGQWGRPVGPMSTKRQEKFRHYSDIPSECLNGPLPDLVLVDGRFRVACAMKSLRMLQKSAANWRIVIDDYSGRSEYHAVAEFAEPLLVGRMAILSGLNPAADINRLDSQIRRWETVPA
jgi:hypothetical protein